MFFDKVTIFLILIVNIVAYAQEKINLSKEVRNQLNELIENDQKYRIKLAGIDMDSLALITLDSLSTFDKINELFVSNKSDTFSKIEKDSLWDLQYKIDIQNSKKLFKIISEYGYLNQENSNCNIPLHIVLMHTPEQFKERTLKLVEQEYEKGKISQFNYLNIIWHLNGRNGLPFEYEVVKENDSINKQ